MERSRFFVYHLYLEYTLTAKAILALADGTIFKGISIGIEGDSVGEVVFNTSMTGYQEILTDPSYSNQMVTLTYPHVGNTGTTPIDAESSKVHVAGFIIKDLPFLASNFRSELSLGDYLKTNNIVAISNIDTRKLTRILREKGAQSGCLITGDNIDEAKAVAKANGFDGLQGLDLAKVVTTDKSYPWVDKTWVLETDSHPTFNKADAQYKVVAYDFGVKSNILRLLADRNCNITVVPAKTTAKDVLAMNPDGVFLSNGPGDPEPCNYAIDAVKTFLDNDIPLFGICLGHQILALACGAKTVKMKFGHHGANHPVQDLATKKVHITSQNHGFAVDETTLPSNVKATHISLFDGSLQGIKRIDKPAFSFQGHPEASPGPQDISGLFDQFINLMEEGKGA